MRLDESEESDESRADEPGFEKIRVKKKWSCHGEERRKEEEEDDEEEEGKVFLSYLQSEMTMMMITSRWRRSTEVHNYNFASCEAFLLLEKHRVDFSLVDVCSRCEKENHEPQLVCRLTQSQLPAAATPDKKLRVQNFKRGGDKK